MPLRPAHPHGGVQENLSCARAHRTDMRQGQLSHTYTILASFPTSMTKPALPCCPDKGGSHLSSLLEYQHSFRQHSGSKGPWKSTQTLDSIKHQTQPWPSVTARTSPWFQLPVQATQVSMSLCNNTNLRHTHGIMWHLHHEHPHDLWYLRPWMLTQARTEVQT